MFKVELFQNDRLIAKKVCQDKECFLGKSSVAFLPLKGWLIGKQQIRLYRQTDDIFVEDMGGITGITVNGNTVNRYGPLSSADTIELVNYKIKVHEMVVPVTAPTVPNPSGKEERTANVHPVEMAMPTPNSKKEEELAYSEIDTAEGIALRLRIHKKLIDVMDLRRVNVARMNDEELRSTVSRLIDEIIDSDPALKAFTGKREILRDSVLNEVIGLGPLEQLIADDSVSEIMVNCHNEIFIERHGRLVRSTISFSNDAAVQSAIERIVAPIGRRIDESSPMVDARLKDGSRVNAVIPPLALKGPSITIRKFSKKKLKDEDLIKFGSISAPMVAFLKVAVERRANIVISGGTGSGKTTLLNVLSNYIPDDERIVTVEDAAELKLTQPNLVSLEARPANIEGRGAVAIRDLVKNCLRMRPDRIVVGECRGGEAVDMLQAMNTGHDGSLTTLHANSPRDCLSRLEVLTLMSGLDIPVLAIREQVASAVDIIVQQTRFSCGSRKVTHISEVVGVESGIVTLQDIFVFKQDGFDQHGKVKGAFVATGHIPDFYQDLIKRGLQADTSIFKSGSRDLAPVIEGRF